jgi:protein-disulfide isomerase
LNQLSHNRSTVAAFAFSALFASFLTAGAFAQTEVPAAPSKAPAPAADANAGPVFPKPEPADFTADAPTREQISEFLQASWGYDTNRVFQIQRIAKTVIPGVSTVIVAVGEKGNKQTGALQFFAMPDGKHIIASGEILPFGPHPYAENRATLQAKADGPSEGGAGKDLELVEFADFQCPHCKDAQATMAKLVTDFPNAHIVYESFPLVKIHPEAFRAAAYGSCVAKLGGNKAFFDFAAAVYEGQAGLASAEGATLTLNSAVTKAGQAPDKIEACSKTPETKASVESGVKLAEELNVNQTPWLFVNGRGIPLGGVNYDTLKQMIAYHSSHDNAGK